MLVVSAWLATSMRVTEPAGPKNLRIAASWGGASRRLRGSHRSGWCAVSGMRQMTMKLMIAAAMT